MKCPKCKRDLATYRAEVKVCPQCHSMLDAEQLLKVLKELKISNECIREIKRRVGVNKLMSQ